MKLSNWWAFIALVGFYWWAFTGGVYTFLTFSVGFYWWAFTGGVLHLFDFLGGLLLVGFYWWGFTPF